MLGLNGRSRSQTTVFAHSTIIYHNFPAKLTQPLHGTVLSAKLQPNTGHLTAKLRTLRKTVFGDSPGFASKTLISVQGINSSRFSEPGESQPAEIVQLSFQLGSQSNINTPRFGVILQVRRSKKSETSRRQAKKSRNSSLLAGIPLRPKPFPLLK